MSFQISREPIEDEVGAINAASGARVTFVGAVRDHNDGRSVLSLEYEAFDELAVKTGSRILAEARSRFPINSAVCIHRVGHLRIGDVAIRVDVTSSHRQEAFEACRWIVDEVKARVPIWKKEHYAEGNSDWINSSPATQNSREELEMSYYSRQALLPQVDQSLLRNASVLVIGAGGLGSPVLEYLAGAGVGQLTVLDGDRLEPHNLHRQVLFDHKDVGANKAELAVRRIAALNPFIQAAAIGERLTAANAEKLVEDCDVVVDCTDNFATKFLLNDICVAAGKLLVLASIYQFEGQMMVVAPGQPCLRCVWPEAPDEGCVGSCAEVGVLGVVPGFFGVMQANEVLKIILRLPSPLREGKMLLADMVTLEQHVLKVEKNPDCPACGRGSASLSVESTVADGLLIDIREEEEVASHPLPGALVMPMSRFAKDALPASSRYILVCARGVRSAQLARRLREEGDQRFFSLAGGTSRLRP